MWLEREQPFFLFGSTLCDWTKMAACVWEIIHEYGLKQILNARMAIRQRAHLVTSGISISTLEIRQERTSRFYLRVEWTSAFKGFDYRCCRMRLFRHCCMSSCTREVVKVLSARFLFHLDINVFITLSI